MRTTEIFCLPAVAVHTVVVVNHQGSMSFVMENKGVANTEYQVVVWIDVGVGGARPVMLVCVRAEGASNEIFTPSDIA